MLVLTHILYVFYLHNLSFLHPLSLVFLLSQDDNKEYSGPSPGALLDPLFKQSSCSYRVRTSKFHSCFSLSVSIYLYLYLLSIYRYYSVVMAVDSHLTLLAYVADRVILDIWSVPWEACETIPWGEGDWPGQCAEDKSSEMFHAELV